MNWKWCIHICINVCDCSVSPNVFVPCRYLRILPSLLWSTVLECNTLVDRKMTRIIISSVKHLNKYCNLATKEWNWACSCAESDLAFSSTRTSWSVAGIATLNVTLDLRIKSQCTYPKQKNQISCLSIVYYWMLPSCNLHRCMLILTARSPRQHLLIWKT